jgi:hypothetical protein
MCNRAMTSCVMVLKSTMTQLAMCNRAMASCVMVLKSTMMATVIKRGCGRRALVTTRMLKQS